MWQVDLSWSESLSRRVTGLTTMEDQSKQGLPIWLFEDQAAFEAWLKLHFADEIGIWLKIAKKGSGVNSVSYDQAVESALCYGWIDSQIAHFDTQYYLQKFSPRLPKSKWSRMNREKSEALMVAGRMQTPGYHQVSLAQQDGRWQAAYDAQSQITIPDDFQKALDENPEAAAFFSTLNSQNRYAILHRLQITRKPEARRAKIQKFIRMLINNEKIYP